MGLVSIIFGIGNGISFSEKVRNCRHQHSNDELNCDYPQEVESFPKVLKAIMENAAAKYCKSLPIPAVPEVGDHWIH